MDNVHVLGGGERPAKNGEPNPEVIDYCEKLLEMAKSGKLQWIAHAALADDGFFCASWMRAGEGQTLKAAGAIAILQHDYLSAYREQDG